MKKLIIIFLCCNVYTFAQNRKAQIEQLSFKLDSTNTVLANDRNSLNIKIIGLNIKINELTKSIEQQQKIIATTQSELASKQNEIGQLKEIINSKAELISLIGTWCNKSRSEETDEELFSLEIKNDWYEKGSIISTYSNLGPFQERSVVNFHDNEINLFFDYVEGTNSFNEAIQAEEHNLRCKGTKTATISLIDSDKIKITFYENECSRMPQNGSIILSRFGCYQY